MPISAKIAPDVEKSIRYTGKSTGVPWYVDAVGGDPTNNGSTPELAFDTITAAISAATAGDQIHVKAGIYDEADLDLDKDGLTLLCESGVILKNTSPSVALTTSADHCRVDNATVDQAGQIGFLVTGDSCRLVNCVVLNASVGFDVDGINGELINCRALLYSSTGFDISGRRAVFQICTAIGAGGTTRGFYLSANTATYNVFFKCLSSGGNSIAGFEVVLGADSNLFYNCASGEGDGLRIDGGANNLWPDWMDSSQAGICCMAGIPKFNGTIWYVNGLTGDDTNHDGRSPVLPFATIGKAITSASAGDKISVASGVYNENGLNLDKNYLDLLCERGVIFSNSAPGTILIVSGNYCHVFGGFFAQAGQIGIQITGTICIFEEVIASGCAVGFDVDGNGTTLRRCLAGSCTTTAFDVSAANVAFELCYAPGAGGSTRGFYLSGAGADRSIFKDCFSLANGTAGFETVVGTSQNSFIRCASGAGDGRRVDNGTDNFWVDFYDELDTEHHEHVYPFPNGEGVAGDPLNVTTDAADESNGPETTKDYFGEPVVIFPLGTMPTMLKWLGVYIYGNTSNKFLRITAYKLSSAISSNKNGGNAWDEGETILTVIDGSLFQTDDLVWIYSGYKPNGEIVKVSSVVGNVVTIVRETSQFPANNTGLRWDHTTNAGGTEKMVLCRRPTVLKYHGFEFDFSCASNKDFTRLSWHAHKRLDAGDGVALRAINGTDNTNGTNFDCTMFYED